MKALGLVEFLFLDEGNESFSKLKYKSDVVLRKATVVDTPTPTTGSMEHVSQRRPLVFPRSASRAAITICDETASPAG